MPAPRKYPSELRERANRLVVEAREQELDLSLNAAAKRIAPRVGIVVDTLRGWCKQVDIDAERRPWTTTSEAARLKELERGEPGAEAGERDPVGGLLVLRAKARPATALVTAFIDEVKDRFGIEPVYRVLASRRSSPTPARGGSSGGAPLTPCPPSCRWTRWRWRCGPGNAPARTSPG